MATVYLADDLKHERKVALKVLKPELAAVVGAERFLRRDRATRERGLGAFESLVQSGRFDTAGLWDVLWTRDLLGDDPRYQALLEEAGITW